MSRSAKMIFPEYTGQYRLYQELKILKQTTIKIDELKWVAVKEPGELAWLCPKIFTSILLNKQTEVKHEVGNAYQVDEY